MLTYVCFKCGKRYRSDVSEYLCSDDGSVLDIEINYLDLVRKAWRPGSMRPGEMSLWRFSGLIPVSTPDDNNNILSTVGGTPLVYAEQLNSALGDRVWIKNDSLLPTGSLKDRASAVVVSHALERGIEVIMTASTGNAGVALAGMAAAGGLRAVVLAPSSLPVGKAAQIIAYGAELVLVDGSYSDAYDVAVQASTEMGIYCRNTGYNPLTIEGKKTVSYEICEQLTDILDKGNNGAYWKVPDVVIVPVGDGNMISGVHKGFADLMAIGMVSRMPKIVGVQAEGSAAITNAYKNGESVITEVSSRTIADSISADRPADGYRAIQAVKNTGGQCFTVDDKEIANSVRELAAGTGIFAEASAAVAYAGLKMLQKNEWVKAGDNVVMLITGHGLKNVGDLNVNMDRLARIKPSVAALGDILKNKEIIL